MATAQLLTRIAAELALFAAVGFLLFALNDLAVDLIYFARRLWRVGDRLSAAIPRAFAKRLADAPAEPALHRHLRARLGRSRR